MEPTRIVLRERAPRPDYAVRFDADAFVVEGVALLPDRRVALRDLFGIERAGSWLWIGAGVVPLVLGGDDVPAERLARVEAELRARIGALPGGAARLARIDARRPLRLRPPWLAAAAVLALGAAAWTFALLDVRAAANLLLLAAVGVGAEPVLGPLRLLACGAAAWAGACLALGVAGSVGPADALALAPLALALGWAALAVAARLGRAAALSVRARSALDASLLLGPLVAAHALALGAGALAAAALAGALGAPLLLRSWPDGAHPRAPSG
jgi:hypothetical protein